MIDYYVFLTPILMLPIVALLGFVGCSFSIGVLATPRVPVLGGVAGDGNVTLTWPADIDVDKFLVKRGIASGVYLPFRDVLAGVGTFDDTVINGTTYYYVVSAWQGLTESANSNEVMLTPTGIVSAVKPFIIKKTLGSIVPSAQGSFGMVVQVGGAPLTVKTLGRAFAPGNVQIHTVQILTAAGVAVNGGFVQIDMSGGTIGEFKYAPIVSANAVVLAANTRYYIVSQEMSGGDQFYNHDTLITETSGAAVVTSSVRGDGVTFIEDRPGMFAYGPVNFEYT